mmetsp:Transcript_13134/g.18817  ORF Transcript_13134/g.18817 Transcript_13134/m.18817 type:complete len:195 (+) Transcript_13134:56-640(+)
MMNKLIKFTNHQNTKSLISRRFSLRSSSILELSPLSSELHNFYTLFGNKNQLLRLSPPPLLSSSSTTCQSKFQHRYLSSDIKRLGTDDPRMSQIVTHNGVVYISGQIDPTTDDIEGQTKNILDKIDLLLWEAGTNKSKLLTATLWLKHLNKDFQTVNKLWIDWVDSENKPVRATVEANMALPSLLVEIQVTAAL